MDNMEGGRPLECERVSRESLGGAHAGGRTRSCGGSLADVRGRASLSTHMFPMGPLQAAARLLPNDIER